ncbi:MAG: hypothetical protein KBI41_14195, partial [Kiritimatiellae bacterium]|nr:hypothetical protein [Kiritimatiellia bacterium]MDD3585428.1 hypothetical protein [Kiritimatiellia bacterium]
PPSDSALPKPLPNAKLNPIQHLKEARSRQPAASVALAAGWRDPLLITFFVFGIDYSEKKTMVCCVVGLVPLRKQGVNLWLRRQRREQKAKS